MPLGQAAGIPGPAVVVCVLAVGAACSGDVQVVRAVVMVLVGAVVSRGWPDLAACDRCRRRPQAHEDLLAAADRGDLAGVQRIATEHFPRPSAVDRPRTQGAGRSALMSAAFAGHQQVLQELLQRGADATLADRGPRFTAVQYACMEGHLECVRNLLDGRGLVNAQSKSGLTPLLCAASEGHDALALFLLERGADPKLRAVRDGPTVLSALLFAPAPGPARRDVTKAVLTAKADPQETVRGRPVAEIARSLGSDLLDLLDPPRASPIDADGD